MDVSFRDVEKKRLQLLPFMLTLAKKNQWVMSPSSAASHEVFFSPLFCLWFTCCNWAAVNDKKLALKMTRICYCCMLTYDVTQKMTTNEWRHVCWMCKFVIWLLVLAILWYFYYSTAATESELKDQWEKYWDKINFINWIISTGNIGNMQPSK